MQRLIRWLTSLTFAFAVAACGGGGGGDATVVLAGDPAQPASTALQEKRSARVDKSDIVQGHLLTRLFVVFKADATVGQVNAAAQAAGASEIAASSTKLLMLTLQVPRQAGIGQMHALAERVRAQPGVFFAWPAREFKASVLPEAAPGQPVSPLDLSHLLSTRFPQAWNARGAAPTDCLPHSVPVYVFDKFGDASSRPTFFGQIDSNGFVRDTAGALAAVPGHGFDVVSTLAAAFDAQKPTGANPFRDCLVIHQIDAFGRDLSEAIVHTLDKLRSVTENRFILTVSVGFPDTFCGPNGDQLCDANTIRTTPIGLLRGAINLRAILAAAWASEIGATNLGQRMLVTQSAGNVDPAPDGFLARSYRGFRSASFSSPAALATHVGQLSSLLLDTSLWRSQTDPSLPDITFPAADVTALVNLLVQAGASTSLVADNLLIVDSATDAEAFIDVRSSDFNFLGADVRAVGENVKLFDVPSVTGTSFAAPQVAGLASYMWVLSDRLRNLHPSFTVSLIKNTGRTSGNSPTVPLIDAYAAVQFLDTLSFALDGTNDRLIRKALVDVNGDGNFDHLDLLKFEQAYRLTDPNRPSIPSARDYSRFDLNGDGFTGGILIGQFALGTGETSVTVPIEGFDITMNEAALSDIQILCFYAYSDLYATSPVNRAEALLERTRMLGATHCVGARINALLPAQISTSASLNVTVEVPAANGQFAPAPNMLVDFTPTCATVNPTSGRTNASGVISTTVTPNAGCSSVSVNAVARADVGTITLAQKTVTASIQENIPITNNRFFDGTELAGIVGSLASSRTARWMLQPAGPGVSRLMRVIDDGGVDFSCDDGSAGGRLPFRCSPPFSNTGGGISGTALGKTVTGSVGNGALSFVLDEPCHNVEGSTCRTRFEGTLLIVQMTPTSLDFGAVPVGQTSIQPVTIRNTGLLQVRLALNVAVGGNQLELTIISSTCGARSSLNPFPFHLRVEGGATCDVIIQFKPQFPRAVTGKLFDASSGGGGFFIPITPQEISLRGVGI